MGRRRLVCRGRQRWRMPRERQRAADLSYARHQYLRRKERCRHADIQPSGSAGRRGGATADAVRAGRDDCRRSADPRLGRRARVCTNRFGLRIPMKSPQRTIAKRSVKRPQRTIAKRSVKSPQRTIAKRSIKSPQRTIAKRSIKSPQRTIAKRYARGFSMIELLVAVLVMGIGVLGITGLQLVSLQNNRGALFRGEAVQFAYDIMDRIRANPGGTYNGVAFTTAPAAPTNRIANNCSEADMAVFDRAVWKCSLGNFNANATCIALRNALVLPPVDKQPGLPNGDGAMAVDGATQIVTVSVRWLEPNATQATTITIQSQG